VAALELGVPADQGGVEDDQHVREPSRVDVVPVGRPPQYGVVYLRLARRGRLPVGRRTVV
jgi:hypothetical protein